MPKKSSQLSFSRLVHKSGFDNSMGDLNHITFDFIDNKKLQYEFEEYLKEKLREMGAKNV